MVIELEEDEMDCMEVYVGATNMTMNERFTMLAASSPFLRAGPRRARRRSTNNGPLLSSHTKNFRNQNIIDEVVHQLGLDWRMHEIQQINRSGMSRYGSESSLSSLARDNYDQLSQGNSFCNMSQHSGRDSSRLVRFKRQPVLNLDMRLQMRNAWMRGWRARGRKRGRGGVQNRGIPWNWQNQPQRGRGRKNRRGRGRNQRSNQGSTNGPGVVTRSMSSLYNGWETGTARGGARGRGSGRGRGGTPRGVSQNCMPKLKTLEELDKELDDYMAATPASLDKQLEEYMAQNMDLDL